MRPFMILNVDPGGYEAISALSNRGLTVSACSSEKFSDLILPTSRLGSYEGDVTRVRISPVAGSMTTIDPVLFFISFSPYSCRLISIVDQRFVPGMAMVSYLPSA